jgi:hypothetical protein
MLSESGHRLGTLVYVAKKPRAFIWAHSISVSLRGTIVSGVARLITKVPDPALLASNG